MSSNLPPGVTPSMLPGNSGEEAAWEKVVEDVLWDSGEKNLAPPEAREAWQMGLVAFLRCRQFVRELDAEAEAEAKEMEAP